MRVWPGSPYPLGATWDGAGTNFALFSRVAERVELCLFGGDGPAQSAPETRAELTEADGFVWHGYLPGIGPGQRYGYRVHGPYEPGRGLRCNPAKLLLDPYAKAVEGAVRRSRAVYGHRPEDPSAPSTADSAPYVPRGVVAGTDFDWGDDRPPRTPAQDTLIYEAHARGLTIRHPHIPAELRGSYAAVGHPAMIEHLLRLGVTAVELLPVHQFLPEPALAQRGLVNYWGYNSICFLAPHNAYSSAGQRGEQVREFKAMVRALHQAGLEVLLDVVYNHTAEACPLGPTLSLRGIDNAAYYRLHGDDPSRYVDDTGCGNSLNVRHPRALQLIMDSLRYWVLDMHVDGFRLDLAPALTRERGEADRCAAFLRMVGQDPVVSQVKLIAEPWDVGPGGYQLGSFPAPWAEWNGQYVGAVRDYWRGQPGSLPEFASRLAGSSQTFQASGRRPAASVNYVTCHDGFTLQDLVSYDRKHNLANGEQDRDGSDDNRSWNCGVEGPSGDPEITRLRARQKRNFLVSLMCSQGMPMLLAGDELGRSQAGNNNAYCQDNELTWLDWELSPAGEEFLGFVRAVTGLRRAHRVFRRRTFFRGRPPGAPRGGPADVIWFLPSGKELAGPDWNAPDGGCLGVFLDGRDAARASDAAGPGDQDAAPTDSFLLLFNPRCEPVTFALPDARFGPGWEVALDTAAGESAGPGGAAEGQAGPSGGRGVRRAQPGGPGQCRQQVGPGAPRRGPGPGRRLEICNCAGGAGASYAMPLSTGGGPGASKL